MGNATKAASAKAEKQAETRVYASIEEEQALNPMVQKTVTQATSGASTRRAAIEMQIALGVRPSMFIAPDREGSTQTVEGWAALKAAVQKGMPPAAKKLLAIPKDSKKLTGALADGVTEKRTEPTKANRRYWVNYVTNELSNQKRALENKVAQKANGGKSGRVRTVKVRLDELLTKAKIIIDKVYDDESHYGHDKETVKKLHEFTHAALAYVPHLRDIDLKD